MIFVKKFPKILDFYLRKMYTDKNDFKPQDFCGFFEEDQGIGRKISMDVRRKTEVITGTKRDEAVFFVPDFSLIEKFNIAHPFIFPGFCDVHVHFREPGFSYKEDIASGCAAAAHGGYTSVCTMPNLSPVPDCRENLQVELDAIHRCASIDVYPYGSITKGEAGEELSDMEAMRGDVIAFSDDGRGVQSVEMMKRAMEQAARLGKMIVAHCEVNSLLRGGYVHDGEYAAAHGHKGICSESEYAEVERDIFLAEKTGVRFHVCHISTAESVALIRQAKRRGVDISCETAPHYLLLDESDLREDGRWKMNPPLRGKKDREALIDGIIDGTVDMIATDHAPHSEEEKSRGLAGSSFGIVGLETAFPLLYTGLVQKEIISLEKLVDLLAVNPRKRFGIKPCGYSVWDLEEEYVIDENDFLSKGKSTPFIGQTVNGKNHLTVCGKNAVYKKEE